MKVNKSLILTVALLLILFNNIKAECKTEKKDSVKLTTAIVKSLPKFSGYIIARYQNTDATFAPGKADFDIKNANINMIGNISSTINYRLQVDFSVVPQILDAYAEWKPLKFIGLQVGQFQTPYTFENQYVPKTLELFDNSQVIANLVTAINGVKNKGRDIGLAINGNLFAKAEYNLIDYKIGIFNGNTFNAFDDNSTLDVLGSIYINPIKPLSFSASYLTGKYGPEAIKSDKTRNAYGIKYDDGKALFRAEYITGKTNNIDANGYYAVAGYFVTKNIQPILKYDYFESNSTLQTSGNIQYTAGINYWMPNKSRILINYTYNDSKDPIIKSVGKIAIGLVVAF